MPLPPSVPREHHMRRWNNVLSDASRQMVIELFLGLRLGQHLPSLKLHYPPPGPPEDPESDTEEADEDGLHAPRQVWPPPHRQQRHRSPLQPCTLEW